MGKKQNTYKVPNKPFHTPTATSIHDVITMYTQINTLIDHFLAIDFGKITLQFATVTVLVLNKLFKSCERDMSQTTNGEK